MTYALLALVVGLLMRFGGIPWLPVVEGFAIFAPVHFIMHRGRGFVVSYYVSIMGMASFVGFVIYKGGYVYDWRRLLLAFAASAAIGFIDRWFLASRR